MLGLRGKFNPFLTAEFAGTEHNFVGHAVKNMWRGD